LVDGAQAIAHVPVDVRALDCDFYVFSGHKCLARRASACSMASANASKQCPLGRRVATWFGREFEATDYMPIPHRFEAGTPDISGAIGLGVALDFISAIGLPAIALHETRLLELASAGIERIPAFASSARRSARPASCPCDGRRPCA